jgi:hypothetical protein
MEAQIDEARAEFEGDLNELKIEIEQSSNKQSEPTQPTESGLNSKVVE